MRSASLKHQNEHFLKKKRRIIWRFKKKPYLCTRIKKTTSRSGAVVARWAHNPKVVSSSLASATKKSDLLVTLFLCFIIRLIDYIISLSHRLFVYLDSHLRILISYSPHIINNKCRFVVLTSLFIATEANTNRLERIKWIKIVFKTEDKWH